MLQKTHREISKPQVSARYLADYMAASQQRGRTLIRGCKYQPIARVVQHDEARIAVSKFIRGGDYSDTSKLTAEAQKLRDRMADSDFDRDVLDHNADYIEQFAEVAPEFSLPPAEVLAPGPSAAITLSGVKVTADILFRLRRLTKTNKVRVGAGMLRYAKGKALSPEVARWQSAFLFGYLNLVPPEDGADPEQKLCIVVDAYAGISYGAPTDSTRRFQNMRAACETIAEWWPNIPPPNGAVL